MTTGESPSLAGSFGHFMLRMLKEHRGTPVYWFLISKGYRTYRFLPVFFNRFYPTACDGLLKLTNAYSTPWRVTNLVAPMTRTQA